MKKIFLILALLLFVCTNSSAMMPMLVRSSGGTVTFTSSFETGNGA